MGNFWTSEYGVISKIDPKVAWVDPKKGQKTSNLCYKTFFRTVSHGAAMCHYIAWYNNFHLVVLLGIHFCNRIWGLCRPFGVEIILDKLYLTRNVHKWIRKNIVTKNSRNPEFKIWIFPDRLYMNSGFSDIFHQTYAIWFDPSQIVLYEYI